jgi:RHS repeat-associated protein
MTWSNQHPRHKFHRNSRTQSNAGSAAGILRRFVSLLLTLSLLSSATVAAPQTIMFVVQESKVSFAFWFNASGLPKVIQGRGIGNPRGQEKQVDREAKVARLRIFPGDVTIDPGDRVRFAAIAYDQENNAVGGVKIKWSAQSAIQGRRIRLTPEGELEGAVPGTFTVIAEVARRAAQVTVVVRPGVLRDLKLTPTGTRKVSTRDNPTSTTGSAKKRKKSVDSARVSPKPGLEHREEIALAKRAHASPRKIATAPAAMPLPPEGWGDENYWSADDPGNGVGNPPGGPVDGGAGSGNFQFVAPILSLPGRGINISLSAAYNSRLWNKAGSQINYDNDRGWPAPGFSLGFGKMLGMGVNNGGMLIDADGTRHGYTGSITFYNWGTYGVMHTTDGSFIDYTYWTGTGGGITWAQARLPNGTVVNYGAPGPGAVYPTSIEDANGNYISITYVNNAGPRIQTVTDTLNRVISFHYDYNNLLTAVTSPGLGGGTRTLARFHYHQLGLNYGFSGLTPVVRDSYPWVVDAIYYPGTNTGYWLNDGDSYSSYGMLAKVVEERAMGFSASSLNDMGSVWDGQRSRTETYSYPLSPDYSLTDAPTYTSMVESWSRDGTNFDSATTNYLVYENSSPRSVIITLPNGTKNKQLSYYAPGQWNDGLVFHDETYVTDGQPLQSSNSNWELGAYGSARPTRVEKIDERGQMTATEFSYGGVYNQVAEARDYDYGGTSLLRATRTQYQNSASYTNRHIFNLPLSVELYASDYVTRVSRTEYQYDGQALSATPNVVQHDQAFNPHADAEGFCYWDYDWYDPDCTGNCYDYSCDGYCPQYYVCPYDSSTDYRGNLTQITSYADAVNLTGAVAETARYDTTGNVVTTSTSCCQQTSFNYTSDTQYADPLSQTRGSASDPYAQVTTSATYDFNTSLALSTTNENGRQAQMSYDAATLRKTSVTTSTGAQVIYTYDDAAMAITSTAYLSPSEGSAIADQNVRFLNGRGQLRQEKALGPNSAWDVVDTIYNTMGQPFQQSRPYRLGVESPQFTTATFDSLGRTATVTTPDGSAMQSFYNEATRPSAASGSPGETTRIQDAWGRERWSRSDANGQLVEVVEPDPNGDGSVANNGMVTTYGYNTQGKLTIMNQGAQTRSFKYDALERLTAQKLAEASATLNDAGSYVGGGTWSHVFTYDTRSNLTSRTDPRGIKAVYNYANDPLNRLQSVSWDTSGFGDTANPVLAAAAVTYQYRQKASPSELKDITQREAITTSGVSVESYSYDSEGRVANENLTLTNRASYPMLTDYIYDSMDRVRDVRYPSEYGNGGAPRKVVHHDYDVANRLSGLTFDGQAHASNIAYNAASQTTSIIAGSGANQTTENYNYNGLTGLLENQTVTRGGTTLLNLSYDYAGANGKRNGQITKILNNIDHNKDRGYTYDGLGRLQRATGGQNVNWVQRYNYDRHGNRQTIFSFTADQYVRGFYQGALNRQPDSTELQNWLTTLQSAYAQGLSQFRTAMQNLGETLFNSQEYANRNRSDHDYVYDLYKTYLLRDPDPGGWAFWESQVPINGRAAVRNGFIWSEEFWLKLNGTSPYSPPGGTVPADGLTWMSFDASSNRVNGPGFAYDAAGNQTRALITGGSTSQRFRYDAANRMVQVLADDNTTVLASYMYGDSNERLASLESGLTTYYSSIGGSVVAEFIETSGLPGVLQWAKSYVYLGSRLLSKLTPNGGGGETVEFHHPDHLGTKLVTNPANGTSFEQATLPFGTALAAESTGATNRRFTSYDRSASTGLDYAQNRHYDSQQGRFTQVDPAGMGMSDLENPQTLNLYAYCANDPINRTDPTGLGFFSFLKKLFKVINKILKWIAIVVAIAFAVVVTFALLNLPGAQFLAELFFTALEAAMKWLIKVGIMHFAEGGVTIGAKTIIAGAIGAGLQVVSALAGQTKDPPGKTVRRQQKEVRRQERARRFPRVRIPGSDKPVNPNPEPPRGTPETRSPSPPDPGRKIDPKPEKVRLPENASRWLRFKLGVALVLRGIGNYLSHIVIMVDPEALAELACQEDPGGDLCRQFIIFLPPEKRCRILRCA